MSTRQAVRHLLLTAIKGIDEDEGFGFILSILADAIKLMAEVYKIADQ